MRASQVAVKFNERAIVIMSMKSVLGSGKFLALIRVGRWEYVERIGVAGAVAIVAVTDEQKLLLVEQHRIPVHARTIELPAGIVGDDADHSDESLEAAAQRELLEETGFSAAHLRAVSTGPASSGLASEVVTLMLATGLKRVHAGGGVAQEEITVHEVPLNEAHQWLAEKFREGFLIEPKVFAGLYFLGKAAPSNA